MSWWAFWRRREPAQPIKLDALVVLRRLELTTEMAREAIERRMQSDA